MNKRSQFQIERQDGKIVMIDTTENRYFLTAAQAKSLSKQLNGHAKSLCRVHQLRKKK